jgi:competence ComEA-like helix-hairpin-helix protein
MTPLRRAAFVVFILVSLGVPGLVAYNGLPGRQDSDPARPVFERVCSNCHPTTRVTATRRSRAQWQEVIETMISVRGAKVADEEFETIVGYLAREHGRVNANTAPADEMAEVLGIPEKMAEAIVAYRRDHGTFQDFDALAKVPGVDRDALEKKREAIAF